VNNYSNTTPKFMWTDWGKPWPTSIIVAGNPNKFQTGRLTDVLPLKYPDWLWGNIAIGGMTDARTHTHTHTLSAQFESSTWFSSENLTTGAGSYIRQVAADVRPLSRNHAQRSTLRFLRTKSRCVVHSNKKRKNSTVITTVISLFTWWLYTMLFYKYLYRV